MIYCITRFLALVYLRTFKRFTFVGSKHIPDHGPVIVVANHVSNYDAPAVAAGSRRRIYFMAKHELFVNRLLNWFFRALGAFPIKRHTVDRTAFRQALTILRDGRVLGMFPEGTRSLSGELGKAEQGAAILALRTQSIIIPAGVSIRGRTGNKSQVTFGPPVPWQDLDLGDRMSAEILAERIMSHISELLVHAAY